MIALKRLLLLIAPLLAGLFLLVLATTAHGWMPPPVAERLSFFLPSTEKAEAPPFNRDIRLPVIIPEEEVREKESPEYREALLVAGGDIMVHQTQYQQAYDPEKGSYDFTPSFEGIAPYVQEADLVVLYMHWGHEYHSTPSDEQRELVRFIAEAGGDVIIGNHPHVIQPMEKIAVTKEDGSTHEAFAAYSLGNLISNQHKTSGIPTRDVKFGKLLRLHLRKNTDTGETSLEEVDYILTGSTAAGGTASSPCMKQPQGLPKTIT